MYKLGDGIIRRIRVLRNLLDVYFQLLYHCCTKIQKKHCKFLTYNALYLHFVIWLGFEPRTL